MGPRAWMRTASKRMLACKSFKKSSMNLCDSLTTLARRLCTEFVDPLTIEPILASLLIPLDQEPIALDLIKAIRTSGRSV